MNIGWLFTSVRNRLIFWFLVVALIPLLAVSALISKQRITAIKMRETNKLTAIRELKVKQVEQWLEERIGDVLTISEDLEIRDLERVISQAGAADTKTPGLRTAVYPGHLHFQALTGTEHGFCRTGCMPHPPQAQRGCPRGLD